MKKRLVTLFLSGTLALSMIVTSLASGWIQDGIGWWYQNYDGSYPSNGWHWIDGNNDGTAECYFFNDQGYCLINTTTPDGYVVDTNGAWTIDGVVQTKKSSLAPSAIFAANTVQFTAPPSEADAPSSLIPKSVVPSGAQVPTTFVTMNTPSAVLNAGNDFTSYNTPLIADENVEDADSDDFFESLDRLGKITVEKGLFNVKLTVPADSIKDTSIIELETEARENGYTVRQNANGSVTYDMTKTQHTQMMAELKDTMVQSLNEMIGSLDYPNITNIRYNDNFTVFSITTRNKDLDLAEAFSVLLYYMYGCLYNIFNGTPIDNIYIEFVNANSGAIIYSSNLNDL